MCIRDRPPLEDQRRLQHWAVAVAARRGHNKAAIAVANKLARIVWAVWRSEQNVNTGPCVAVAA